jgi:hypothetical protein
VVHLTVGNGKEKKRNVAQRAAQNAKSEAGAKVHDTLDEIRAPGKMQRLKEMLLAQSPYRRQYLQPGTRFYASLTETLDLERRQGRQSSSRNWGRVHPDTEHGTTDAAGDPSVRAGAGVSGSEITGTLISLAAKSQPVSMAFAAWGAGTSVYNNFLSRGKDVVFKKDTPLEIGFSEPHAKAAKKR